MFHCSFCSTLTQRAKVGTERKENMRRPHECKSGHCCLQIFRLLIPASNVKHVLSSAQLTQPCKYELLKPSYPFGCILVQCLCHVLPLCFSKSHFSFSLFVSVFPCFFESNLLQPSLIRYFPCWQEGCNELAGVVWWLVGKPSVVFDRGSRTITGLMLLPVFFPFPVSSSKLFHFRLPLAIWMCPRAKSSSKSNKCNGERCSICLEQADKRQTGLNFLGAVSDEQLERKDLTRNNPHKEFFFVVSASFCSLTIVDWPNTTGEEKRGKEWKQKWTKTEKEQNTLEHYRPFHWFNNRWTIYKSQPYDLKAFSLFELVLTKPVFMCIPCHDSNQMLNWTSFRHSTRLYKPQWGVHCFGVFFVSTARWITGKLLKAPHRIPYICSGQQL